MALKNPKEMTFERMYTEKFRAQAAPHGVAIKYEQDIAALDLGIHLTVCDEVTNSRIWLQLKGLHTHTLPQDRFELRDAVAYKVKIKDLRTWFQAPEPVYFVLFIEAANLFLAEDVREIVLRQFGDELLNDAMFKSGQKTTTIKVLRNAQVDGAFWLRLRKHRSMRADGRMFRGRPLGHDLDPLRTTLRQLEPALFVELVRDLLSEHGYRAGEILDEKRLFTETGPAANLALLECGVLHDKFEIVLQCMTEKISDGADGFRVEGESDFVQGPCAVLIHSGVASSPSLGGLKLLAKELVKTKRITRLLAFINANMWGKVKCCGAYTEALRKSRLRCSPQHLEDISFNFLITTNTYHRFRDKVSYRGRKLWRKSQSPVFVLTPAGWIKKAPGNNK